MGCFTNDFDSVGYSGIKNNYSGKDKKDSIHEGVFKNNLYAHVIENGFYDRSSKFSFALFGDKSLSTVTENEEFIEILTS